MEQDVRPFQQEKLSKNLTDGCDCHKYGTQSENRRCLEQNHEAEFRHTFLRSIPVHGLSRDFHHSVHSDENHDAGFDAETAADAAQYVVDGGVFSEFSNPVTSVAALAGTDGFECAVTLQ